MKESFRNSDLYDIMLAVFSTLVHVGWCLCIRELCLKLHIQIFRPLSSCVDIWNYINWRICTVYRNVCSFYFYLKCMNVIPYSHAPLEYVMFLFYQLCDKRAVCIITKLHSLFRKFRASFSVQATFNFFYRSFKMYWNRNHRNIN